jgi:pimeloyl-ACP methyl ester carboxylesterase
VTIHHSIQPTRAEVTVRGQRIAYQVAGSGEPVVLVHGLAGSTRWWCRNVAALAETHTVYVLNLPGFGAFRLGLPRIGPFRGRGARFSLEAAADWLTDWIEAVGIGPCHIVGHSMGGHIAIRVAARRPDLVRRLVLVAPALVAGRRSIVGLPLALVGAVRAATPSFLPILAFDTLRAGPVTMLGATYNLFRHDVYDDLRRVSAPTLLVWGTRDALVPPALGPAFQTEIPDARLLYLRGAGHVVQYDRAVQFNDAALAFLSGQQSTA